MTEHDVVIAGAGPTGMMLAAELTLAGADAVVVERRPTPELESSRAGGLHCRTIEVLDQRGIAGRFLEAGRPMQVGQFAFVPLDISDFPTRHPYGLALFQNRIEQLLAEWVEELGVAVMRATQVTGFTQDDRRVAIDTTSGPLSAQYLVGCDGGRSLVRKQAGIGFPGWDAETSYLIAEVELSGEPRFGLNQDAKGTYAMGPLENGHVRVVLREEDATRATEPTLDELRAALVALYGSDFGLQRADWLSWFTDATRQAETYRSGRVLLAGDAAHVHSPMGGQGLNLGVQDAVNLGWKLARVVKGEADDELLDTYGAERHPVAARALRLTMAMTALSKVSDRMDALRETFADLITIDEARKRYAALVSGLDVHYDLGGDHPLVGRRMPDLDLGSTRVYELLHDAEPVVLDFANGDYAKPDRIELPVIGEVAVPDVIEIRPDGYVSAVSSAGA